MCGVITGRPAWLGASGSCSPRMNEDSLVAGPAQPGEPPPCQWAKSCPLLLLPTAAGSGPAPPVGGDFCLGAAAASQVGHLLGGLEEPAWASSCVWKEGHSEVPHWVADRSPAASFLTRLSSLPRKSYGLQKPSFTPSLEVPHAEAVVLQAAVRHPKVRLLAALCVPSVLPVVAQDRWCPGVLPRPLPHTCCTRSQREWGGEDQ